METYVKTFEQFIFEANGGELVITPKTFSKDEKFLYKTLAKVYRGTGILKSVKDAISTQMQYGNDSKIKSITLTGDDSDSEVYIELTNGTIYDRANLELPEVIDDIKLSDNAIAIAKHIIKKWGIKAMTKAGVPVHFTYISKSNYKNFGEKRGFNLYDVEMKIDKGEYTVIGNASNEKDMVKVIKDTKLFK